jgi:hypothetical protein
MSKSMMLMAGVLSVAAPCTLTAASPADVPARDVARSTHNRTLVSKPEPDESAVQAMHLSIRGRTATWSFYFSCAGPHCRFRNSHHSRDRQELSYISLATIFGQQTEKGNTHERRIRVTK